MKGKKEFAVLFFVIAVLVFYIYSEKNEKTHYDLPDIEKIALDEISKVSVKKKDLEIALTKENDTWYIGPSKYRADNSVVSRMLEGISGLALTALASESKNYSIYELDDDRRIDVEAYKGDILLRKVRIGKPASSYRHTFVMLDDDHRIYHAQGNIKNDFDKKIADLRDKKVMAFDDDITEILLKKGESHMKIVRAAAPVSVSGAEEPGEGKAEESAPKWTTSDGKVVKESEVNGIVNTLSSFLCDDYIEGKTKEHFTSPVFTATLKGINTYTISLFEKKDNQYPAVSSGSEYPFLISEWKANSIMKDFASLLEQEQSN